MLWLLNNLCWNGYGDFQCIWFHQPLNSLRLPQSPHEGQRQAPKVDFEETIGYNWVVLREFLHCYQYFYFYTNYSLQCFFGQNWQHIMLCVKSVFQNKVSILSPLNDCWPITHSFVTMRLVTMQLVTVHLITM